MRATGMSTAIIAMTEAIEVIVESIAVMSAVDVKTNKREI
jgi:hypothetical protein